MTLSSVGGIRPIFVLIEEKYIRPLSILRGRKRKLFRKNNHIFQIKKKKVRKMLSKASGTRTRRERKHRIFKE